MNNLYLRQMYEYYIKEKKKNTKKKYFISILYRITYVFVCGNFRFTLPLIWEILKRRINLFLAYIIQICTQPILSECRNFLNDATKTNVSFFFFWTFFSSIEEIFWSFRLFDNTWIIYRIWRVIYPVLSPRIPSILFTQYIRIDELLQPHCKRNWVEREMSYETIMKLQKKRRERERKKKYFRLTLKQYLFFLENKEKEFSFLENRENEQSASNNNEFLFLWNYAYNKRKQ